MELIIGLGNPGKQYENTRHNTGFFVLDKIRESWNFPVFEFNKKLNAEVSKGHNVFLVKPQTFMNLSGESIRAALDFYKLTPDDILIIHDDMDIPLGKYKMATDSSSAGHNGVQNIIDRLDTQKFRRVRIGIGQEKKDALVCRLDAHPPRVDEASPRVEAGDFVLQKFSEEEIKTLEKLSEEVLKEVKKTASLS